MARGERGRLSQTEVVGTVVLVGLVLGSIAAAYTWGMPLISKSGDANRIEYVKQVFERLSNDFARVAREGGQATTSVQLDKGEMKLEIDQTGSYVLVYTLTTEMRFFAPREITIDDSFSPYVQKDAWLYATSPVGGPFHCLQVDLTCTKNGTFTSATALPEELLGKEVCLCTSGGVDKIMFPETGRSYSVTGPFSSPIEGTEYKLDSISFTDNYASLISDKFETGTGLLGKDKPGAVLAQSAPIGKIYQTKLKLKPRNIFDPASSELLVIKATPAEGTSTALKGNFEITLKNEGSVLSSINGQKVRIVTISISMH